MYHQSHTYYSQIYREFKSLDERAYRAIIHYFEKNESKIEQLDFEEYFELLVCYTTALLANEEYHKHLSISDEVIAVSMSQNVVSHKGEDILQHMLYQKAWSYFKLSEYKKAIYMLSELLKINPFDSDAEKLLYKSLWNDKVRFLQGFKAISIFSFLLCALVIAVELVLIRTLFPNYTAIVELSRNSLFVFGIVSLVLGYATHSFLLYRKGKRILSQAKMKFLYAE
jgi:tetratricopeptide (TPR) repeat protein